MVDLSYQSKDIAETKAKEKREIFVKNEKVQKPFPTKLVIKLSIIILILAGIGLAIYLNWPAIYHNFFEVSEERARELLVNNTEKSAKMYEKLASAEKDNKKRANSEIYYGSLILSTCYNDETNNCSKSILEIVKEFADDAEKTLSSYNSAKLTYAYSVISGNTSKAEEWGQKAQERYQEGEEGLGEG